MGQYAPVYPTGIEHVVVSDITGKKLIEKAANNNDIEFDLSDYPAAMYLLKVQTNHGVQTKKLVVE